MSHIDHVTCFPNEIANRYYPQANMATFERDGRIRVLILELTELKLILEDQSELTRQVTLDEIEDLCHRLCVVSNFAKIREKVFAGRLDI